MENTKYMAFTVMGSDKEVFIESTSLSGGMVFKNGQLTVIGMTCCDRDGGSNTYPRGKNLLVVLELPVKTSRKRMVEKINKEGGDIQARVYKARDFKNEGDLIPFIQEFEAPKTTYTQIC